MFKEFENYLLKYISSINQYKDKKVYIILNQMSGCVKNKNYFLKYKELLRNLTQDMEYISKDIEFLADDKNSIESFLKKIIKTEKQIYIFSFGGDGTHQFILQNLLDNGALENVNLLMVPFGTGNDGSIGSDFFEFLLKIKEYETKQRDIIKIEMKNKTYCCHNIVSVGFDAMVLYLTNITKNYIPGNYYKFYTYITPFLYDIFYKKTSQIKVYLEDGDTKSKEMILGLMAFGSSGVRKYGGGMPVLPDQRNLCLIENPKTIFDKLEFKDKFLKGEHINLKGVSMYKAKAIDYFINSDMAMQIDGEEVIIKNETVKFLKTNSIIKM